MDNDEKKCKELEDENDKGDIKIKRRWKDSMVRERRGEMKRVLLDGKED